MPERLNGTVSKTVIRATVSRVRIPLFPQVKVLTPRQGHFLFPGACRVYPAKRMGIKNDARSAALKLLLDASPYRIGAANPSLSAEK